MSTLFDSVMNAAREAGAGEPHTWKTGPGDWFEYEDGEFCEDESERVLKVGDPVLHKRRHFSFGGADGPPVYAWTETHVIVPCCHDGKQWHKAVPLTPNHPLPGYLDEEETIQGGANYGR